jgi:hypothetical protein
MLSITAANSQQIQGFQQVSKKYKPVAAPLEEVSPFLMVDPGVATRENFKHVLQTFIDEPNEDNGLTLLACNLRCRLAGVVSPDEADSTKKFVLDTYADKVANLAVAQVASIATLGVKVVASDSEPYPVATSADGKKPPTVGRYNPATVLRLVKADHKVRPGSGADDDLKVFRAMDGKTLGEIIPKLKSGGSAIGYWKKRGVIDLEG